MSIVCFRVKRSCLLLNWILWKGLGNSFCVLGAPDRAGDDSEFNVKLVAPPWVMEEQILLAAFKHVKHPVSPRTTLEPCKPGVVKSKPASLDMP